MDELNTIFTPGAFRAAETDSYSSSPIFGAADPYSTAGFNNLLKTLLNDSKSTSGRSNDLTKALEALFGDMDEYKEKGQKELAMGAAFKTIGAASDFFSKAAALSSGQIDNIYEAADIAKKNYENQMTSLDNQVLFLKNQLSDRFNKTIETNIMNMAARNLRVNTGSLFEATKGVAQDITEDITMAESNAALKKIALAGKQKQVKESAKYAEKQLWTSLVGSAAKLGLMITTGGGTGESWGNLFAGLYGNSKSEEE